MPGGIEIIALLVGGIPPERGRWVVLKFSGRSPARRFPRPVEAGLWSAPRTPRSLCRCCWATRTWTLAPGGTIRWYRRRARRTPYRERLPPGGVAAAVPIRPAAAG